MSEIEYNNLLFEISRSLDELNVCEQLMFSCRGKLASGSEDNIPDVLSLFKELEARNHLGPDRLGIMKALLKGVKQYELLGKVKKFENERKEYLDLLEKIIPVLDELNDLERLISICRAEIPEVNVNNIQDVRSLFKELENQSCLGTDSLGVVRGILIQTEQNNLRKELDKFEERRNREDLFEARKAQVSAIVSSVRNNLIGVLSIKNVFKLAAGGLITASALDVWSRGSSFDELVTAVNRCVLPASTNLIQITEGCVCLTIQAHSLSALDNLWSLYQDGTLKARLETFFATDQLRELADGEQVETFVTIEEQEYKRARIELIVITQAEEEPNERRRRTSDSFLSPKRDEVTMMKLQQAEIKLDLEREKRKATEQEIMKLKFENEKLEEEGPVERRRRTSDSFLFLSPKRDEVTLMKLQLAENRLELEKEKRRAVQWENIQLRLETGKIEVREREDVERLRGRHRRNSDSELYCKAKDIQIRETEKKHQFLEDKHAFIQKYLENVPETHSVITETSDSGVATPGTSSELGTEDVSATDEAQRLRVKDIRPELLNELKLKIDADTVTARHICQSFGITDDITAEAIFKSLPDIPLQLLRDVFEVLELLDLVELLDKEIKPSSSSSLRAFPTLNMIRKLMNTDSRPVTFHSKAAVLIVTSEEQNPIDKEAVQFFKDLNLDSTVSISMHPDYKTLQTIKPKFTEKMERNRWSIRELMHLLNEHKQRGMPETGAEVRRLTEQLESERQGLERLEKELKEIENTEEHARAAASMVIDEWIQCQDDFSLFAVFDFGPFGFCHDLIMKLAREIPNKPKLIITKWTEGEVLPETLLVTATIHIGLLIETLLAILKRRWQTLNLASMMREFKRTAKTAGPLYFWFNNVKRDNWDITIKDTLSSLVRLKREEGSG